MNIGSVRTYSGDGVKVFVKRVGQNSFKLFIQEARHQWYSYSASNLPAFVWNTLAWNNLTQNNLNTILSNSVLHPNTPRRNR